MATTLTLGRVERFGFSPAARRLRPTFVRRNTPGERADEGKREVHEGRLLEQVVPSTGSRCRSGIEIVGVAPSRGYEEPELGL